MSPNRRIILNILTTYGRTLLGVICGVFSTRWILMALGHEDFGLFGVVGSLAIFVIFFNIQFSAALGRFYAFSIGKAQKNTMNYLSLNECQCWFTVGVLVHSVLPIILIGIGYPSGSYLISSGWLTIPPEKIDVCIWLWRFVMISCFWGMIVVPYQAMFIAKQYIAELTVYSILQVIVRTGFIFYMTTVQKDWLLDYGLAMCIIAIIPQILIGIRAVQCFPECRLQIQAFNINRIKKIASYSWWQMFSGIGYLARHQCSELLVNKLFGSRVNAAYTIGATVSGEAAALTGALNGAFSPAIATYYGAGEISRAISMAYRACKFGTLLTLIFAIPLCLEINQILLIWLKDPPVYASGLCVCSLMVVVIEKLAMGHILLINASGNVSACYFFRGISCLTAIPLALAATFFCKNVYMVGLALVITTCLVCLVDVIMAKVKVKMDITNWILHILIPLLIVSFISFTIGIIPRLLMQESIFRIIVVTLLVELCLLPLVWICILDVNEKEYLRLRLKNIFSFKV